MMADHGLVPRQKAVGLDVVFLVFQLHYARRAKVDQVRITNVGKKRIGKAIGMLNKEFVKIRFPEKINELRKRSFCFAPAVTMLEMIFMKKLYVLHALKVSNRQSGSGNRRIIYA